VTNEEFGRWLWNNNCGRATMRQKIMSLSAPMPDVVIGYLNACNEATTKAMADIVMLKRKGMIK